MGAARSVAAVERANAANRCNDLPVATEIRTSFVVGLDGLRHIDASEWQETFVAGVELVVMLKDQLHQFVAVDEVNTRAACRLPPRPGFEITFCDLKEAHSSEFKRKAKSEGNRAQFRRTA